MNHPLSYGRPVCWDYHQFDFWNEERDAAIGIREGYNCGYRDPSYSKAPGRRLAHDAHRD